MVYLRCIASLALLLGGMAGMTAALSRAGAAGRLFARMRRSAADAFGCGFAATVLMQSSSASTVLIVGAYDAQRLPYFAVLSAIAGANVGTTLTGWLLCAGLGAGWWTFAVLGIGAFVALLCGNKRVSGAAVGLLGVELGLALLSGGADASSALTALLGSAGSFGKFLRAAGLTAIIQSSSAVIGFLQGAATGGALTRQTALALVLGSNVGTCATALLAAIPGGRGARVAAATHLGFNLLASALGTVFFGVFRPLLRGCASPTDIAAMHTLVNLLPTFLLALVAQCKLTLARRSDLYYDNDAKE